MAETGEAKYEFSAPVEWHWLDVLEGQERLKVCQTAFACMSASPMARLDYLNFFARVCCNFKQGGMTKMTKRRGV